MLFSIKADSPAYGSYRTVFSHNLDSGELQQLSFFPERVSYLEKSKQLQIQNRFGIFRSRLGGDKGISAPKLVKKFPSFADGEEIYSGKIRQVGSSPDGRYVLFIRPESHAYGKLVLLEVDNGTSHTISDRITVSYEEPNALWAPDSRYFVYEKAAKLYYFSMNQLQRNEIMDEELRLIGDGTLSNVQWTKQNQLYYIDESVLYRIFSAEFFTRSFYSDLLDAGQVVGKIPFDFDFNFDSFYVSPDGAKLLFNKGGRNLILYYLKRDDYLSTGSTVSLPYLYLPRNTRVKRLLWSEDDIITVLTGNIQGGQSNSSLFRLDLDALKDRETDSLSFEKIDAEQIQDMVLAPGGGHAALIYPDRAEGKASTIAGRTNKQPQADAEPMYANWTAEDELIVSGRKYIKRYRLNEADDKLVTLSQPGSYGYGNDGRIYTRIAGEYYGFDRENKWERAETNNLDIKEASIANEDYRVYLNENPEGRSYANMIMVRHIQEYKTTQLGAHSGHSYEPFPEKKEPINFKNFSHGSRIRRREVALVFNAVDSIEGLTEILNTLNDYGLESTFFVNGEFMRRNPEAVIELSQSGHEIGSLFYSYFDMTDARYRISKEFIKQGLARNEDEYFNLTADEGGRGDELALLWHTPYYFVNNQIIEASSEMNYTYISYDVDPLDWVSKDQQNGMYRASPELVERILLKKKPGSIIPIRIGTVKGGRDDYLFQYLDLLIDGLVSKGYTVVPVSTLIEHAR
ncbi:MAG: polysaccharide deacetylase family protein [Spirochaetia bacterium]|nr:polysaccharide deacetylase family protein [Spirochaetia bacterium]